MDELSSSAPATPSRRLVACPVCDFGEFDVVYEPTVVIDAPARLYGAASGVRGAQRLVRCQGCGLLYENPQFSAEQVVAGYAASQDSGHDSQRPMRVRSFARALRKLREHLPPPGSRVLDIGTAGGAFLEAATQCGYDAYGMEPSRYLVEQGRLRGLKVEQGTIDNHGFEPSSFDLICLWDVLEHLTDPKAALKEVARLLKPDGVVLINYPDIGTLAGAARRPAFLVALVGAPAAFRPAFHPRHVQPGGPGSFPVPALLADPGVRLSGDHGRTARGPAGITHRSRDARAPATDPHSVLREPDHGSCETPPMTVFILGGGPAGLALADGLARGRPVIRAPRAGQDARRSGADRGVARCGEPRSWTSQAVHPRPRAHGTSPGTPAAGFVAGPRQAEFDLHGRPLPAVSAITVLSPPGLRAAQVRPHDRRLRFRDGQTAASGTAGTANV